MKNKYKYIYHSRFFSFLFLYRQVGAGPAGRGGPERRGLQRDHAVGFERRGRRKAAFKGHTLDRSRVRLRFQPPSWTVERVLKKKRDARDALRLLDMGSRP